MNTAEHTRFIFLSILFFAISFKIRTYCEGCFIPILVIAFSLVILGVVKLIQYRKKIKRTKNYE